MPADDPQLLIFVEVDEPEHQGTTVSNEGAAKLEKAIMTELLPYLGIPKAGN